jgi:pilus assembly protein CpaE
MKDVTRIVLVDPNEQSREAFRRLLGGMSAFWLTEVFTSYQNLGVRVKEIGAHLTIVTLDHEPNQAIELIQAMSQVDPNAVILPASRTSDSTLILRAIRAGAREFLTLPTEPRELLDTVNRILRGRLDSLTTEEAAPKIITFAGAAGGVGTTTIAVNLATTLAANKKQEVLLLDLDLMFGSVDACLDIITDHTLTNVIQNFERLDLMLLKRSMTRHGSGLYLLPHPIELEDASRIDPDTFGRLLGLLKAAFDTVVIDASKSLQSSDFIAYEMSDVILVVTQLDLVALRNTSRLLTLFRQSEGLADHVKLIVNRVGSTDTEISIKKAEETLKMPISWQIPNAYKAFQLARTKGVPLSDIAKGCRPHQVFLEMARSIQPMAADASSKPRKGLFAALF